MKVVSEYVFWKLHKAGPTIKTSDVLCLIISYYYQCCKQVFFSKVKKEQ